MFRLMQRVLNSGERRQIFKMLKKKGMIFLGSDCHGVHHRAPNLIKGRNALEKKMGKAFMDEMDAQALYLLNREER